MHYKPLFLQLIYFLLFLNTFAQAETIKISQSEGVFAHDVARGIIEQVYSKVGQDVEFVVYPSQRGLVMANGGENDGDVARVEGIEKKFPNLRTISSPILIIKCYAYGLNSDIKIDKWADLEGYRVGIIHGIQYMVEGTKDMSPTVFNNFETMFLLMIEGRIDVVISSELQEQYTLSKTFPNQQVFILGEPLYDAPLYHVLNTKHDALASDLNNMILDMKASGEYDAVYNRVLEQEINRK